MAAQGIAPGFLAVRPDWLAQHTEAALEPDLPIVDPHHHLWDRPGNAYLLPDLLAEILPDAGARKTMLTALGIRVPE